MTITYESVLENGVLSVAGETKTLFASAARSAVKTNEAGTAVDISGYSRGIAVFQITNADTDAGDTLDVYVDVSPDGGTTWLNAAHFTQVIGTGSAATEFAVFDRANPGTAVIAATSDCAAAAVRPTAWGDQMRGRYTLVDAGTVNASFTFGLKVYVF